MQPYYFYLLAVLVSVQAALLPAAESERNASGIPISFTLDTAGYVTLVIDDHDGKRVKNLISETAFGAGEHTIQWDGSGDSSMAGSESKETGPGKYRVRGLIRPDIGLKYEFSVYSPGIPPWRTKDQSGGWLANHTAPSSILAIPAGEAPLRDGKPGSAGEQILVGSFLAEGTHGIAWLDGEGNKLYGQEWMGGLWTGATQLALDKGKNPIPGVYAYAAAGWRGDKYDGYVPELRLIALLKSPNKNEMPKDARMGEGGDRLVINPPYRLTGLPPTPRRIVQDTAEDDTRSDQVLTGMAVRNGLIVVSLNAASELCFVDARQGKVVKHLPLADPKGLAYNAKGELFAISGSRIVKYSPFGNADAIGAPQVVCDTGFDDPQQLIVDDASANILVSDWGTAQQVKVISPTGRLIRCIGKAGALGVGPYDPTHMNRPRGMTMDQRGRLWVAENDKAPKRISVWSPAGVFEKAFYGPPRYGGGGSLDPLDPSRFFYADGGGGMEFQLDWKTGESRVVAVYYRPELDPAALNPRPGDVFGVAPSTPIDLRGKTYLTDCYGSDPVQGKLISAIWLLEGGIARKVAAFGNAAYKGKLLAEFANPSFSSLLPAGYNPGVQALFFGWSDRNANGRMDPDEVEFLLPGHARSPQNQGGITVQNDLSFVCALMGDQAVKFAPETFTSDDVPIYNFRTPRTLAVDASAPPSSGGGQVLVGNNDWCLFTTAPKPYSSSSFAGFQNGEPKWSYPSQWPGLHASHAAPLPDAPGEVIGSTRLLGNPINPRNSDAGELWAINGNKGNVYLFTFDGLFVATLFADSRIASWSHVGIERGTDVKDFSLMEECFWPSITQELPGGKVYLQVASSPGEIKIVHVTGLEGIRRLPDQDIEVSPETLQALQQAKREEGIKHQVETIEPKTMRIPMLKDAGSPEKADEQKHLDWVTIELRKVLMAGAARIVRTDAALMIAKGNLYVFCKTTDKDLLENNGDSISRLFTTGGGLDLMIGAESGDASRTHPILGDKRLILARAKDKIRAVLFSPVSGKSDAAPFDYSSPIKSTHLDDVEDVSEPVSLSVKSTGGAQNQTLYQFSIPLTALGISPQSGLQIKGDIGVLRGDGIRTIQRAYWNNKTSGLVSDIPSEAELIPALWGTFEFVPVE